MIELTLTVKNDGWSEQKSQTYSNDAPDEEMNAHLSERFRGGMRPQNGSQYTNRDTIPKLKFNPDVSQYIQEQDRFQQAAEPGDWLAMPEIPPGNEIVSTLR